MTGSAKVSIIVPVYNVETYLPKCLESCINQTLYDIEIVCVNDGSTDSSLKILQQYAAIDDRIIVVDKPNGGLSSARNAGLDVAGGEWIMFLDSDDYLAPGACERVWVESKEAWTEIITFGSEIFPNNPAPTEWHNQTLHIGTKRYYENSVVALFNEPGAKPFVWRQAFSKKLLDNTGVRFDENIAYGEDIVFQFNIFPRAKSISFISDRLYCYRWYRKGSLMESYNRSPDYKMESHIVITEKIAELWNEKGWLKQYPSYFLGWIMDFVVYDLTAVAYEDKKEYAARIRAVIEKYDLGSQTKNVNRDHRDLYKRLLKM